MTLPHRLPDIHFRDDCLDAMPFRFHGEGALPCTFLAGNTAPECWHMGADYAFVRLHIAETGDLVADTKHAYAELIARVRASKHPYLIRIWNYFADINVGDEDAERYRQFCVGRAQAVDAEFNNPPPAATAIGSPANDGLHVIALCSSLPAIALENARQTPAWQYPRQYGKVSPGFSRGAVLNAGTDAPVLLASGTASIVGHASMHVDDVAEQCRESLRNLRTLLDEGERHSRKPFAFTECQALRVYLRDPAQLEAVRSVFEASGIPAQNIVYLHGEVCRRELAVELEGVFSAM
jgi:chorismate lyase / 3-hydroxybenzoate synthase